MHYFEPTLVLACQQLSFYPNSEFTQKFAYLKDLAAVLHCDDMAGLLLKLHNSKKFCSNLVEVLGGASLFLETGMQDVQATFNSFLDEVGPQGTVRSFGDSVMSRISCVQPAIVTELPDSLGNFCIKKYKLGDSVMATTFCKGLKRVESDYGSQWSMEKEALRRLKLNTSEEVIGEVSTTFGTKAGGIFHLKGATFVCWAYPVCHTELVSTLLSSNNECGVMLAVGFWIFMTRNPVEGQPDVVEGALGLTPASKADVDAGQSLLEMKKVALLSTELKTSLDNDCRWQPVTVKFLKDMGVQRFAWLQPDELPDVLPLGGFAYSYDHEYRHFNCVLALVQGI